MQQAGFSIADYIGIGFVVLGIILGFRKGLSGQMALILSGLSVTAALVNGFTSTRDWLGSQLALSPELARIGALLILVVIPITIIMLLYALLRYLLKITFTTWIDRLGGAIAGGFTSAGLVLLVFLILNFLPADKRPATASEDSWIAREVLGVQTQLIQRISTRVEKGENVLLKARRERTGKREKWEE